MTVDAVKHRAVVARLHQVVVAKLLQAATLVPTLAVTPDVDHAVDCYPDYSTVATHAVTQAAVTVAVLPAQAATALLRQHQQRLAKQLLLLQLR